MKFKAADGAVFDDKTLDEMAKEYEDGTWTGCGPISMGRPRLYDEDMETVSFRLPHSRIVAIDAVTKRLSISKSEFYRQAVDRELMVLA